MILYIYKGANSWNLLTMKNYFRKKENTGQKKKFYFVLLKRFREIAKCDYYFRPVCLSVRPSA